MYKNLYVKILPLLVVLISTILNAVELNWEHNYNKALIQAQKEKKSIYLFIGADKCKYCKKFKEQTLSNKKLIEDMKKKYVLIYMSRDQHKIPTKFEQYGVPRHYFLNSYGDIIADTQGFQDISWWRDTLDEVKFIKEEK